MEGLSAVRLRDQERGQEDSIFDDDRSFRHDPDSSSVHLLVPPRPQSQRFHSHEIQVVDSHWSHTIRLWQTCWFLLTIFLSIFIFATVKIYQIRGNFAPVQKHTFNTISTALILALGLNFFVSHPNLAGATCAETESTIATQEAFKSLAKGSQSRILRLENYNLREKELISNIENLTDVIILGWKSCQKPYTKPWTALLCITWVRSPSRSLAYFIYPQNCRQSSLVSCSSKNNLRGALILTTADEFVDPHQHCRLVFPFSSQPS